MQVRLFEKRTLPIAAVDQPWESWHPPPQQRGIEQDAGSDGRLAGVEITLNWRSSFRLSQCGQTGA